MYADILGLVFTQKYLCQHGQTFLPVKRQSLGLLYIRTMREMKLQMYKYCIFLSTVMNNVNYGSSAARVVNKFGTTMAPGYTRISDKGMMIICYRYFNKFFQSCFL